MSVFDAQEEVWLDRDNVLEWVIAIDGVNQTDLSGTTRAVVCIGTDTVDYDVDGSNVIWWTDSVTAKTLPDGTSYTGDVVRVKPGKATLTTVRAEVAASAQEFVEYEDCRLVVFDTDNTNGAVASDNILITVYPACVT